MYKILVFWLIDWHYVSMTRHSDHIDGEGQVSITLLSLFIDRFQYAAFTFSESTMRCDIQRACLIAFTVTDENLPAVVLILTPLNLCAVDHLLTTSLNVQ